MDLYKTKIFKRDNGLKVKLTVSFNKKWNYLLHFKEPGKMWQPVLYERVEPWQHKDYMQMNKRKKKVEYLLWVTEDELMGAMNELYEMMRPRL